MNLVILVLFLVISIIHLYQSFHDMKKERAKTKPFLLVMLLLFYVLSSKVKDIYLILALAFSWLGDVLLIFPGNKMFITGGISFLIAHFCFIIHFTELILLSHFSWILPLIGIIYIVVSVKVIEKIKATTPKNMVVPLWLYLISNSFMNLFALWVFLQHPHISTFIAYLGALLFFVSDCVLFLVRYYPNRDLIYHRHFSVMLAYLLGELLLTVGSLLYQG